MKDWLTQKRALVVLIVVFGSLLAVGLYLMPDDGYEAIRKEQSEKHKKEMEKRQQEIDADE